MASWLQVRVIAGQFKGRRLKAPSWDGLRPTSDKLRETLFNILSPRIAGAQVVDGFAGTGAIGIEALSRGAAHVLFIERDRRAAALIASNLALCGVKQGYTIDSGDVASALRRAPRGTERDLVLLDPPYDIDPDTRDARPRGGGRGTGRRRAGRARAGLAPRAGRAVRPQPRARRGVGRQHVDVFSRRGPLRSARRAVKARDPPGEDMTPSGAPNGRLAVFPGSFDPLTNGHVDIILRSAHLFERVIVAVLVNADKKPLFTSDERVAIVREVFREYANVEVESFDGLLVEYAKRRRASAIVRGLRAVSDFEYEFQMALMNRHLEPTLETVFMMPAEQYTYLSSRLIKEVFQLGGEVGVWCRRPSSARCGRSRDGQVAVGARGQGLGRIRNVCTEACTGRAVGDTQGGGGSGTAAARRAQGG